MEIRAYIGLGLLVVQACIALALIVSLRRTRELAGISLVSETAWVVAGLGWLAYGAATSSAVLVASGALAALGSTAVLVCLRGSIDAKRGRELAAAGAICSAIAIAATAIWGTGGLGVFLAVFGLMQFLPQLHVSVRHIAHRTGASVPLAGAALRTIYTATWALYAGAWWLWDMQPHEMDWPLAVWGITGAIAFGLQFVTGLMTTRENARVVSVPMPSS